MRLYAVLIFSFGVFSSSAFSAITPPYQYYLIQEPGNQGWVQKFFQYDAQNRRVHNIHDAPVAGGLIEQIAVLGANSGQALVVAKQAARPNGLSDVILLDGKSSYSLMGLDAEALCAFDNGEALLLVERSGEVKVLTRTVVESWAANGQSTALIVGNVRGYKNMFSGDITHVTALSKNQFVALTDKMAVVVFTVDKHNRLALNQVVDINWHLNSQLQGRPFTAGLGLIAKGDRVWVLGLLDSRNGANATAAVQVDLNASKIETAVELSASGTSNIQLLEMSGGGVRLRSDDALAEVSSSGKVSVIGVRHFNISSVASGPLVLAHTIAYDVLRDQVSANATSSPKAPPPAPAVSAPPPHPPAFHPPVPKVALEDPNDPYTVQGFKNLLQRLYKTVRTKTEARAKLPLADIEGDLTAMTAYRWAFFVNQNRTLQMVVSSLAADLEAREAAARLGLTFANGGLGVVSGKENTETKFKDFCEFLSRFEMKRRKICKGAVAGES